MFDANVMESVSEIPHEIHRVSIARGVGKRKVVKRVWRYTCTVNDKAGGTCRREGTYGDDACILRYQYVMFTDKDIRNLLKSFVAFLVIDAATYSTKVRGASISPPFSQDKITPSLNIQS